jgi:hypothetical protein
MGALKTKESRRANGEARSAIVVKEFEGKVTGVTLLAMQMTEQPKDDYE